MKELRAFFLKPQSARRSRGFTLVEIMVVLVIIGLVFAVAFPNISTKFRTGLKSASRRLVGTIRYSFDHSALEGRIHRLVLDIDEKKYWVESLEKKEAIYEDSLALSQDPDDKTKPKKEDKKALPFKKVEGRNSAEQELPTGVVFKSVLTERAQKPIESGKAFIHFFPHGFAEQSIIHLQNESNPDTIYSLMVSPMTGKVTVYHDYVDKFEKFE